MFFLSSLFSLLKNFVSFLFGRNLLRLYMDQQDEQQQPLQPSYEEPKTEEDFLEALNKPGDSVVVEFFAPQYTYCREHSGMLGSLANDNRGQGIWFVRANCNSLKLYVQKNRDELKITSLPMYIMFREKQVFKRLEIRSRNFIPEDDAELQRLVERWMMDQSWMDG